MRPVQTITPEQATQALAAGGHDIQSIRRIEEGSNHFVFDVRLGDGRPAICKFAKVRETEVGLGGAQRDTLFGGPLSLAREEAIFTAVRTQGGLPAPEVYATGDSP